MTSLETFIPDLLRAVVALFVIVDPLGQVPVFLGLTRSMSKEARRRAFNLAIYTGSALLFVFALAGQQLLALFGISLHSFMIAGGILLLLLAIRTLISGEDMVKTSTPEDVGIVPIAFPLLVGPGAITTTMITLQSSGIVVAVASIAVVMAATWVVLRLIDRIYRLIGRVGSLVIARVMAVFIAAIAIEFILDGIRFYFPG